MKNQTTTIHLALILLFCTGFGVRPLFEGAATKADVIFHGRVRDVRANAGGKLREVAEVEVVACWKGAIKVGDVVEIEFDTDALYPAHQFIKGTDYVIFASSLRHNRFLTNLSHINCRIHNGLVLHWQPQDGETTFTIQQVANQIAEYLAHGTVSELSVNDPERQRILLRREHARDSACKWMEAMASGNVKETLEETSLPFQTRKTRFTAQEFDVFETVTDVQNWVETEIKQLKLSSPVQIDRIDSSHGPDGSWGFAVAGSNKERRFTFSVITQDEPPFKVNEASVLMYVTKPQLPENVLTPPYGELELKELVNRRVMVQTEATSKLPGGTSQTRVEVTGGLCEAVTNDTVTVAGTILNLEAVTKITVSAERN